MGRMVALLALLAMTGSRAAVDENVAELLAQRSRSRDSVIPLTEDLLREAVVGRNRPYTVVIFFSAQQSMLEVEFRLRLGTGFERIDGSMLPAARQKGINRFNTDPASLFFLTGRQGQLGAEGFMLGSLYLLVSCSLAFVTTVAPRISSTPLRGACSLLGAVLAAGGMYQTFALWTLKTGYKHVFYL
ncbi:hypothetical protein TSOC_004750 [Tetrabaena socialis]|uniref:Uncharacterized protein n=1 Tax=Tetrabaena socialis TaxID=47790 RepID=A0A2J8A804_9CHLO|nr:hypothetical protein TSOC_004750 [Tetrabaena socialis]|eukprot:PNH08669.1 hypothetical protein TSOC_004750 [Tetrabaena socialis]